MFIINVNDKMFTIYIIRKSGKKTEKRYILDNLAKIINIYCYYFCIFLKQENKSMLQTKKVKSQNITFYFLYDISIKIYIFRKNGQKPKGENECKII